MFLEKVTKEDLPALYKKAESAFPFEERRDTADELACFEFKEFSFNIINDGIPVGFAALWEYDGFIFVEHLAVDSDKRSSGYGGKFIELLKGKNKRIILEAEKPETDIQKRRIAFYSRHGFKVNDFSYFQPSYHGGEKVPLLVLSYPSTLTNDEFDEFISETRRTAYLDL